jgi:hypothetical protein
MTFLEIAAHRLANQRLTGKKFSKPEDAIRWLGAVQSQDYPGAKWGLAQRVKGVTNTKLDKLYSEGKILRTHILRPTWHFVLPEDILWIQGLTAPRVQAFCANYYRKVELDSSTLIRTNKIIEKSLSADKYLTRAELQTIFKEKGITTDTLRLSFIMINAELDSIICSGPLKGKQFTYALLEERAPGAKTLKRDEALAELAKRYFTSHGPATAHDFSWWSGLTVADARRGIQMIKGKFYTEEINGKDFIFPSRSRLTGTKPPLIHLLPNYDEHTVAYKDHSTSFEPSVFKKIKGNNVPLMAHIITINGLVSGGWKRAFKGNTAAIEATMLVKLKKDERAALKQAAEDYGKFMGMQVELGVK